jgi:hypothetical protein
MIDMRLYIYFSISSDEPDVRYTAVSGFVFLRFFAPAILNPKLFQMRNEHPVSIIITYSRKRNGPRIEPWVTPHNVKKKKQ